MSRKLLFNNAAAIPAAAAGTTTPADVTAARIAAFNADDFSAGTLDLSSPAPSGVERIQLVQGGGDNEAIITSVINIADVQRVVSKTYEAPTAQVTDITTATGSGFATVKIVQINQGFKPHKRVSAEVKITDKTTEEITDAVVSQLNKQLPKFMTASNSANKIRITGDIGVSFSTALSGAAEDWARSVTAPNFGSGSPAQVAALEEVAYGAGYMNRISLPIKPTSYAADSNYDLHTIEVKTNTTPNISKGNAVQEITLAVVTATSGMDLDEFFFGTPEEVSA